MRRTTKGIEHGNVVVTRKGFGVGMLQDGVVREPSFSWKGWW